MPTVRSHGFWLGFACAMVVAHGHGCGRMRAADAGEPPVQMSPYEVSANSVEFQGWRKVSSTNFIVYSDARAREVNQVLRQMEMLHSMAQRYFQRKAVRRPPMIFILPTGGSDWRKIEGKSAVQWRAATTDPAHTLVDLIVAHYDWQQSLVLVFSELGRAELKWLDLPEPLWFQRGIMGFFGAAVLKSGVVSLGHQSHKVGHVMSEGWLPWPAVFSVNFQSPEYARSDTIGRLNGHCSAFVQYLLTNPDPIWTQRLLEWVSLSDAEPQAPESEFKRIFGQDWKAWEKSMDTYLHSGKYHYSSLRFPTGALEIETTDHPLPVREMRELFVITQILNQQVVGSTDALDKLLAKGIKTEALRELLAEACFARKRDEAGLGELRKLIAAGSTNPEVYALASTLVFRARVPELRVRSRMMEGADELRGWCAKAIELEPRSREANRVGAWLDALGPNVEAPQIEAVKQAYRRLAGHSSTVGPISALAVATWRSGDIATARSLGQKLIESPYSDRESKALMVELIREMADASPETVAPRPPSPVR